MDDFLRAIVCIALLTGTFIAGLAVADMKHTREASKELTVFCEPAQPGQTTKCIRIN